MGDIRTVTIQKINTGNAILRKYKVDYYTGVCRLYGIPPETVEKFIEENSREFQKVRYCFKDGTGAGDEEQG